MPNLLQNRRVLLANPPRGASVSAAVLQFLNRLLTPPDAAREALYTALIDGLVADGVWAKLDLLNVCCAFDEGTALTNLVQSSYQSAREQSAGAATFTADEGWTGGGALRRVTTNFNPSTAPAPNFTRNNGGVALWIYGTGAVLAQSGIAIGNAGAELGTLDIYPRYTGDALYFTVNGTDATGTSTDARGGWIAHRTASNAEALYRNGSLVLSGTSASAAVSNAKINVRCEHPTRAYAVFSSLTAGQITAFDARMNTFITAVTGGFP